MSWITSEPLLLVDHAASILTLLIFAGASIGAFNGFRLLKMRRSVQRRKDVFIALQSNDFLFKIFAAKIPCVFAATIGCGLLFYALDLTAKYQQALNFSLGTGLYLYAMYCFGLLHGLQHFDRTINDLDRRLDEIDRRLRHLKKPT